MFMNQSTFNFMFYLKHFLPSIHDNLCAMTFVSVGYGRHTVKQIFKQYKLPRKWIWEMKDINLFQLRQDLKAGNWQSASWDKMNNAAILKLQLALTQKECMSQANKTKSDHLPGVVLMDYENP